MSQQSTTTALITGATSGIGLELVHLFAKDGHDLVLVARNQPELEKIATELIDRFSIKVKIIPQDLSQPQAAQKIYDITQKSGLKIDFLVNNAGFGDLSPFSSSDLSKQIQMINVNVLALTQLTHLYLTHMIKSRSGKILNVASIAAFQPGPNMSVYFASKAFVLHFSEAIAEELKDTNISITCLCPGPTKTNFENRAKSDQLSFFKFGTSNAKSVALAGYKGLMNGRRIVIPGLRNKIITQSYRFLPRQLIVALVKRSQEH